MKILHILDHAIPIPTGYSYRTLAILKEQKLNGWDTCQLTGVRQEEANDNRKLLEGLRFHRTESAPFQSIPLLKYFGMVLAMKKEINKIIALEKPDVIHAHSPSLNALAALWAVRSNRLPVVYEVRAFWEDAAVDHGTVKDSGIKYRSIRMLETWVLKHSDAIVTICEGLKSDIVERGVLPDKVRVVPNSVDPTRFEFMKAPNLEIRQKYGLSNAPVLGFIGSFYAYEGLDLLIEAMPGVLRQRSDVKLLLVGGEEQEEKLRRQVADLGLQESVVFVGRVPHSQVLEYYSAIDILVYPRRSMRLTELVTPLKPLEAMALGKLLVFSDVGGHREIAGPIFEDASFVAGNVDSLERRLLNRIDAIENSGETLRHGRAYVEECRSWKVVVALYKEIYAAAIANYTSVKRLH